MKPIAAALPAIQRNMSASNPSLPAASNATPALLNDQNGRETLTVMLSQSFRALKLYGREPEDFEAINAMFQLVLADYPIDKIKQAFAVYLKRHNELPAPADLVQIIERDGKPPLERAVYISISKKEPETRTSSDWSYMRDFEKYSKTGAF
jgi:hypothetical protein